MGDQQSIPVMIFDPNAREVWENPYALYRKLREEAPICRGPGDMLVVSRYRDCEAVLRDPRWEQPGNLSCSPQQSDKTGGEYEHQNYSGLDHLFPPLPAGHDFKEAGYARRRLVGRAFTRKAATQLKPKLAELTHRMIDDMLAAGEVDFVSFFSKPLIHTLTYDLMGVPEADRANVQRWVGDALRVLDPLSAHSPEDLQRRDQASQELRQFVIGLLADRRADPGDDLLSDFLAAEEDGRRLTEDELVATVVMLMIVIAETTVDLMSLGTMWMLRNPDQFTAFREHPEIAPTAVEEFLRYDSPAQFVMRVALADLEFAGHQIREGEFAIVLLGSGNRDPEAFPDPDRLDLTRRPDHAHFAFAGGHHHCIGAPFARTEAELALSTLVTRVPKLALAGEPELKPTLASHGLAHLPVSVA